MSQSEYTHNVGALPCCQVATCVWAPQAAGATGALCSGRRRRGAEDRPKAVSDPASSTHAKGTSPDRTTKARRSHPESPSMTPSHSKAAADLRSCCRAAAEAVIDRFVSSNTAVAFGNGELVGSRKLSCMQHWELYGCMHVQLSLCTA